MTPDERDDIVKTIVRDTLAERFAKDELVFDPIVVEPAVDEFGDGDGSPYLRILIIFDGDRKHLHPSRTEGILTHVRTELLDTGIEEFPGLAFIGKPEWRSLYPKWRRLHPEVTVEAG